MRIAILTQALHGNYGGLLQNYALQQVLVGLGHTPCTIDRHFNRHGSPLKDFLKWIMRHIKSRYEIGYLTFQQRLMLISEQLRFIEQNIETTGPLYSQDSFDKEVNSGKYDVFIVGSDQCWRPIYSTNILNYFLNFTDDKQLRIAYAASFGTDKWEYSTELTADVSKLAKRFKAISVRERGAVNLCREKLDVSVSWVLDPTMLLGADGFEKFLDRQKRKGITTYLLEETPESTQLINTVVNQTGIRSVTNNLSSPLFRRFEPIRNHKNISVEKWLSNIANSELTITDSFHGVVFSILFNVPFLVKLNGVRGNSRIESLLTDFGLEETLVDNMQDVHIPEFDWDSINAHLAIRREESMSFLINALS